MGENPYASAVGTDSMGSVAPDVTNTASAPPNYEYRFVPPTDAASNPLGKLTLNRLLFKLFLIAEYSNWI